MGTEEEDYASRVPEAPSGGDLEGAAATSSRTVELPAPAPIRPSKRPRRLLIYFLAFALLASAGVVALYAFVHTVVVASGAMQPTLSWGDRVLVRKWRVAPTRGDVLAIRLADRPRQSVLERAVGLPGDELEVLDGHLLVNHLPIPECHVGTYRVGDKSAELYVEYAGDRGYAVLHPREHAWLRCDTQWDCSGGCFSGYCATKQVGPWVVAPGEVWTMSDDRGGRGRAVPIDLVRGIAVRVLTSRTKTGRVFVELDPPLLDPENEGLRERLAKCLADGPPPPPSERGRDSVAL